MEPVLIPSLQAHLDIAELEQVLENGGNLAYLIKEAIDAAKRKVKTEVRSLPDGTTSFVANGVRYIIHGSVAIERYMLFEEFGLIYGTGSPFKQVFDTLIGAQKLLNAHPVKLFDLSVMLNKTTTNIANLELKETYAMQVCSLFINREGEDVASWSPALAAAKIADWKAEALDARFFLRLSAVLVPGFIDAYQLLTPAIGQAQQALTNQSQPQDSASTSD